MTSARMTAAVAWLQLCVIIWGTTLAALGAEAGPKSEKTGNRKMMYGDTSRLGRPFAKDPCVICLKERYLLYYSIPAYDKALAPAGAPRGWAIGIAESRDLVDWRKC